MRGEWEWLKVVKEKISNTKYRYSFETTSCSPFFLADETDIDSNAVNKPVTVTYKTHVQKDGWKQNVTSGISGTIGESKRLEGLTVDLTGNENLGIVYTTHVQDNGWMPWSSNGEISGTVGESKRV